MKSLATSKQILNSQLNLWVKEHVWARCNETDTIRKQCRWFVGSVSKLSNCVQEKCTVFNSHPRNKMIKETVIENIVFWNNMRKIAFSWTFFSVLDVATRCFMPLTLTNWCHLGNPIQIVQWTKSRRCESLESVFCETASTVRTRMAWPVGVRKIAQKEARICTLFFPSESYTNIYFFPVTRHKLQTKVWPWTCLDCVHGSWCNVPANMATHT